VAHERPRNEPRLTATSSYVGGMSATLTRSEIRELSVAACLAALARLEAQTGSIFAELTEVLGWLYALGDIGRKRNQMHPGLRWARLMHAHGWLLTETVYFDGGAMPGSFMPGKTVLAALPVRRWLPRTRIGTRRGAKHLEAEYDAHVAGRAVAETLRAELRRLVGA